jgi:hypothetical protein
MAQFMDVHSGFVGATADQLRAAHERDLEIEAAEGVHFERAWLDSKAGRVYGARCARRRRADAPRRSAGPGGVRCRRTSLRSRRAAVRLGRVQIPSRRGSTPLRAAPRGGPRVAAGCLADGVEHRGGGPGARCRGPGTPPEDRCRRRGRAPGRGVADACARGSLRPHATGAGGAGAGGRRPLEPADRRASLHQREHRRGPRLERHRQARRQWPGRSGGHRRPLGPGA